MLLGEYKYVLKKIKKISFDREQQVKEDDYLLQGAKALNSGRPQQVGVSSAMLWAWVGPQVFALLLGRKETRRERRRQVMHGKKKKSCPPNCFHVQ